MKISHPLYQFDRERAILAVLGKKEGIFYFANKGTITKAGVFSFKTEPYSDKEGLFMKSGHGIFFGAGISRRDLKEYQQNRFLKIFTTKINSLRSRKRAGFIYIFSPKEIIPSLMGMLDPKDARLIKLIIPGNVTQKHPLEIIQRMENFLDERRLGEDFQNGEANKIMEKSEKARKVVGQKSTLVKRRSRLLQ